MEKSPSDHKLLKASFPNIKCSLVMGRYEQILMTKIRDKATTTKDYRLLADMVAEILVVKVVECLPTRELTIETPVSKTIGVALERGVELVSVMRSGDAFLNVFMKHFKGANVSKFLVQRDEKTAEPFFKYAKPSHTLAKNDHDVIITEPMIATGGSLTMVITLLKEMGVLEKNILIASICAAPEGVLRLNQNFPDVKIVTIALDDHLNEKKYIVPGLGDFGDRYFGTLE